MKTKLFFVLNLLTLTLHGSSLSELPLGDKPTSFLNDRVRMRIPAGAIVEPVRATRENPVNDSALVEVFRIKDGEQTLSIWMMDVLATSRYDFEAWLRETDVEDNRKDVVCRSEKLSSETGHQIFVRSYRSASSGHSQVQPPDAWIISPSGMVQKMQAAFSDTPTDLQVDQGSKLIRKMLETLEPGPGKLDLQGGLLTEKISNRGGRVAFSIPNRWIFRREAGKGGWRYGMSQVVPIGEQGPRLEVAFVEQPVLGFVSFLDTGVRHYFGELAGRPVVWYEYRDDAGGLFREAVRPCHESGDGGYLHVVLSYGSREENRTEVDKILNFSLQVSEEVEKPEADGVAAPVNMYAAAVFLSNRIERVRLWSQSFLPMGVVMIGRIEQPSDTMIASRTPILFDGSFCEGIHATRMLQFFAHGYDPLIVRPASIQSNVCDVGTLTFVRTPIEQQRQISVVPRLSELHPGQTRITCALLVANDTPLFLDEGHRRHAPVRVCVDSQTVLSETNVVFSGLSNIPYEIVLRAPGYVTKRLEVSSEMAGPQSGTCVELARANCYRITYQSRVRFSNGGWFQDRWIREKELFVDNDSMLRFTNVRTKRDEPLELSFWTDGKGDFAQYHADGDFFRCGQMDVSSFPAFDDKAPPSTCFKGMIRLKNSCVYLMKHSSEETGMDVEMMFHVTKLNESFHPRPSHK